ncbi:MAG: glycosyltransferase [Pseudomonadota bacterium]
MALSRDRYRHTGVDQRFAELLERLKPDIVHIGHLNHLSTSLVTQAAFREIPILYTLHDYWKFHGMARQKVLRKKSWWAAVGIKCLIMLKSSFK